jgi:hypothetical protein
MRIEKTVVWFSILVALLILLSAYCTDRDGGNFGGDFDELLMQNPAYMLAHSGAITFPAYWFGGGFDHPLTAHPPIHLQWIGWLMHLGFPIYYAEATPVALLLLLGVVAIAYSVFPTPVKLGLLFCIGFLASTGETLTLLFGVRPEGEVQAAWLLGLVLLESGRLDHWNRFRLFAGACFLTWASGTHYYAAPAFLGVAVYLVWVVRSLGWRDGRGRVIALCAGGCLFGVPYLALYLVPYGRQVLGDIRGISGSGSVALSIHRHLALYRSWSHDPHRPALIRLAMASGIPLLVWSSLILVAVRATRGLALAALPLQLFVFLFTWHKMEYYVVHECAFFAGALAVGTLVGVDRLLKSFPSGLRRTVASASAIVLSIGLVWGSPMLAKATVSLQPKVHEVVVARAASREILGPNARISGRGAGWFASGAEHWMDIQADLYGQPGFDVPTYLSNLDAVVDFINDSGNGPLTSWYADGTLKLRGFFFGETSDQLRLVYLSGHAVPQVVGYLERNRHLYRFQEDPGGDYQVLSAACPKDASPWLWPWRETSSSILYFPEGTPDSARLLVTILAPRFAMAPEGQIGRGCRAISRISGTLRFADKETLLARLRREDQPMRFYRILDDMPGYTGVGLPADALLPSGTVALSGMIDLSKAVPLKPGQVQFRPGLRVTTGAGLGTFSAAIPVNRAASVAQPCWLALRLQVLSGHVAFAAFDNRVGIIARSHTIARSVEPQTIALRIADFRSVTHIVIFNDSLVPSGGQVDILSASVLVSEGGAQR